MEKEPKKHYMGCAKLLGDECNCDTYAGDVCEKCLPQPKKKDWKQNFKTEFGIHFSESEFQFCIEFIEELLCKQKETILKEIEKMPTEFPERESDEFDKAYADAKDYVIEIIKKI